MIDQFSERLTQRGILLLMLGALLAISYLVLHRACCVGNDHSFRHLAAIPAVAQKPRPTHHR